ncbi:MAG: hypothetical protein ACTHU0_34320 [Kofleriaceae bacterium]
MPSRLVAGAALAAAALGAGCAGRDQPYRFASPMLGAAEVPPAPLRGDRRGADPNRDPMPREESRDPAIRVATAPKIREASAAAAAAIAEAPVARTEVRAQLSAPHRGDAPRPLLRGVEDLRALVGRRDPRDPLIAVLGWSRELGRTLGPAAGEAGDAGGPTTGGELVAWAEQHERFAAPGEPARPGDLLVFDHATSDDAADLVAIAIARDDRGVTEMIYLAGGVIRRGFVDPSRPSVRRDRAGAVVNTFLRHGRRWPARGTRYLAGELLAGVVR